MAVILNLSATDLTAVCVAQPNLSIQTSLFPAFIVSWPSSDARHFGRFNRLFFDTDGQPAAQTAAGGQLQA